MKKLIAFLLASLMVACCFAVSASASTNLIASRQDYTLSSDDGKIAYNNLNCTDDLCPSTEAPSLGLYQGQVTDGVIRVGTEDSVIASDAAMGITVELVGTNRVFSYVFPLGAQKSVESVVVKVAKIYGNRSANIVGIEVSDDNQTWTVVDFNKSIAPVAYGNQGNVNWGVEGAVEDIRDMFYDITASFAAVNASYVKVTLDTSNPDAAIYFTEAERGYVLSFDEIEIYGGEPVSDEPIVDDPSESDPVDEPSEDVSVDDPSEDVSVDDPSEDVSVDDPSEDVSVDDPSEDVSVDDPSEDVSVDDPSEDVSVDDPSEDVSVDEPSEDVSVEEPSEDTSVEEPDNNTTPSTGDAGLAIFAVLAVVSMAGVVVAKKVK